MTTRDQHIQRIRELFATPQDNIPLHAPLFTGNERRYVLDAIESTFVSSVGAYVGRLEKMIARTWDTIIECGTSTSSNAAS